MRLDVKGAILTTLGVVVVACMLMVMTSNNLILLGLASFGSFIGWLLVVSGVDALWQVRKDKKMRARITAGQLARSQKSQLPTEVKEDEG